MKIYVIAAMHGNEKFGLKILSRLNFNSKKLRLRVGHPEAIAKDRRYIQTDLNRSFRSKGNSQENRLADLLEQEIIHFAPDYVIDIHTSITDVGKAAIVAENNEKTAMLAGILGMDSIVVMSKKFTKNALIGCLPDRSISLEFGRGLRSDGLAEEIANRINGLHHAKPITKRKLPVFEITGTITKGYAHINETSNLKFNSDLGGYPFLVGKNSYKEMSGFLAKRIP